MAKVCHMTNVHGVEDVRIFQKECVSLAKAGYEVYLVERGESYEKNGVHIVGVGDIPADRRRRMTRAPERSMRRRERWMRISTTSMTRSCCPTG